MEVDCFALLAMTIIQLCVLCVLTVCAPLSEANRAVVNLHPLAIFHNASAKRFTSATVL